jgi:hypothetical protein
MTTADLTDKQRAIIDRLQAIRRRLAPVPDLYVERRRLLIRGKKAGILQRVMADAAGLTESAVNKELNKPV